MPVKPKARRALRRENDDVERKTEEQMLAYRIRRVLNIPNIKINEMSNIIYREIKEYISE
jgi:hypothetical protein